jgi:hypothetical protein
MAYMGYHTVTLPSPVAVTSGQPFVVAVKMTTPGYTWPIPVEYQLANYSSAATAAAGQSYVSSTGTSWSDLTIAWNATANVCLKAYVKTSVPPTVTSFTPTSGPVGTSVTLTGTGFLDATGVRFHGTASWAACEVLSDTQITATVPAGATAGTIAVAAPGGTATSATSFTVLFRPKATLKLSGLTSGAMRLGRSVTATGKVTPTSLAGSKVKLTVQKRGARWVTLKSVARTISASGAYSWKYKPARRGAYRMRATIAKTAAHTAATTTWRSFKVK